MSSHRQQPQSQQRQERHRRSADDHDDEEEGNSRRVMRRRENEDTTNRSMNEFQEYILVPSEGARLTFRELSPPQYPPRETHWFVISRAMANPIGLTLLQWDSDTIIYPHRPPDYIPTIHLLNPPHGYAWIRCIRSLRHHAPGWGELGCGIAFQQVADNTYRAPPPNHFVAIKKLDKQVVHNHLFRGRASASSSSPPEVDLTHIDQDYLELVLQIQDRENPYREMSRMDEIGDNIHVLRQIDFLQDDNYFYIIMPYAVGRQSLDMVMFRPQESLSPTEARRYFVQILRILAYLEQHHIHHRDLSPDNFIFLDHDRLVATDLAMSLRIPIIAGQQEQRTLISAMGTFGTPAFMSPEVYNNVRAFDGVAADLWSAMLILYGMLNNLPLYRRPSQEDISFRYFVIARGITRNEMNELMLEILDDVFPPDHDGSAALNYNQSQLYAQALAHVGLSPASHDLFHCFFRINPADRWTLAQVMESVYVRNGGMRSDD